MYGWGGGGGGWGAAGGGAGGWGGGGFLRGLADRVAAARQRRMQGMPGEGAPWGGMMQGGMHGMRGSMGGERPENMPGPIGPMPGAQGDGDMQGRASGMGFAPGWSHGMPMGGGERQMPREPKESGPIVDQRRERR